MLGARVLHELFPQNSVHYCFLDGAVPFPVAPDRCSGKTCPVDLPVGLIDNKGTLLEGLTPQDLTIRQNKQSLAIESVKYDSAPRRVLLLLDTSARLPVDARKAEVALARYLLSRARGQDSFGLLTARGPLRQVHFEEGKESILRGLQELSADPKEAMKGANILDTVVQGIPWFGQPRPGDAILIMADPSGRIERAYPIYRPHDLWHWTHAGRGD